MITPFFAILSSIAYLLSSQNNKIKKISKYSLFIAILNCIITVILFELADNNKLVHQWYTSSFIYDIVGLVLILLPGIYVLKYKTQN